MEWKLSNGYDEIRSHAVDNEISSPMKLSTTEPEAVPEALKSSSYAVTNRSFVIAILHQNSGNDCHFLAGSVQGNKSTNAHSINTELLLHW